MATAVVVVVAATVAMPIGHRGATHPTMDVARVALTGTSGVARTAAAAVGAKAPKAGPGWRHRVRLPNHGQMVVLEWNGAPTAELTMRSRDAKGWSDWVDVDASPDEGPDAGTEGTNHGRTSVGPIWVGTGTTDVELKVTSGTLGGLRLDSLKSNPAAAGSNGLFGAQPAGAAPALPPLPGMVWRQDWAPGGWRYDIAGCEKGPTIASRIDYAVVHHTVNTNTYSASEAYDLMRGIYWSHTNVNGWCDIGYNFVIDRFGRIFEARSGGSDQAVVGGHAEGFNTNSFGVSLLGQHQPGASPPVAAVPAASQAALKRLIVWKFALHGVDAGATVFRTSGGSSRYPAGQVVTLPTIIGHRDVSLTSCPGDYALQLLPALRQAVQAEVSRSGPFTGIRWTPSTTAPKLLTVDRSGGLHPAGGGADAGPADYWPGQNIVRDATGTSQGGYVLDLLGGIHPFGDAVKAGPGAPYTPNQDSARGISLGPVPASGYVVASDGKVSGFGVASPLTSDMWPGLDLAKDIVSSPDGLGGYVLDGWGGIHAFGSAAPVITGNYWPGWDIARAIVLRPDGQGGYVLDGFGGLNAFGGAPPMSVSRYEQKDWARSLVLTGDTGGYVLDSDGRTWPIGDAPAVRSSLTWVGLNLSRTLLTG